MSFATPEEANIREIQVSATIVVTEGIKMAIMPKIISKMLVKRDALNLLELMPVLVELSFTIIFYFYSITRLSFLD